MMPVTDRFRFIGTNTVVLKVLGKLTAEEVEQAREAVRAHYGPDHTVEFWDGTFPAGFGIFD